jgi:phosphatidylglycerol:prolipoprotein diacylglycerol transferase
MIPFVEVHAIKVGDLVQVHPFGLLVVTGCFVGFMMARYEAISRGLDQGHLFRAFVWALVPGFLLSRWLSWLLYFPEIPVHNIAELFAIQESMSSYGGFLGGAIGGVLYLKRNELNIMAYVDSLVFGLVFGWFFGRLGCSLVHDHPGKLTDFFLAVDFPGGARHDLGFYEWLFTILLIAILLIVRREKPADGFITGLVCCCYGPVRFCLDFLRVNDRLYGGFTPAQYFSIVFLLVGIWLLRRENRAS